jgi:hypothetical protein
MEWWVAKTGFEMLDALHAYGLGILLAGASGVRIRLQEEGLWYRLSCPQGIPLQVPFEVLDQILALPTVEDLLAPQSRHGRPPVPLGTFDGLLAVLFTRGERHLSVSDLLRAGRLNEEAARKGLKKVTGATMQWKDYAGRETPQRFEWFARVLDVYTHVPSAVPLPRELRRPHDLTALMTLDPAFGYSTRRPTSDAMLMRKVNIALEGTPYATFWAYLGASRFLRAQRVAGHLVNLYVPLASAITITSETTLGVLSSVDCPAAQALTRQLVGLSGGAAAHRAVEGAWWKGLAYQTLQTQGVQQSISMDRGHLECSWLTAYAQEVGSGPLRFWNSWLRIPDKCTSDEREHLVDFLMHRRPSAWYDHLRDVMRHAYIRNEQGCPLYSREEVKVMTMANLPTADPLRKVLERDEGTLNFGRALRLLALVTQSQSMNLSSGVSSDSDPAGSGTIVELQMMAADEGGPQA